ncbi:hypothetical protein PDIG_11150 [Penicillium digitatum PHI26]|uniref:Uncharacterized protein n=2 Tax=Penicillium digitatum TaxID=36651 RepID=K9GAJ5_PEND2|nr:hypothetical protein PDIP_82660 [Penicillium digitatum Pd1]EKV05586.1 hypothetical protein PDIP_82660 [Penicillium digitatum Pd1]EKV18167.1 hypothetical protein PDIG_11150 [Penicillium digitatum PHI26]
MMCTSKRALKGPEQRGCRPASLDLKSLGLPTYLADGDNLSPFVVQNNQLSPIPGKLFSQALNIKESIKTALTKLANGDDLSPLLVQQIDQPSPIPHALINKSLSINETSEATPLQGPFLFSGHQGNIHPTVKLSPRPSPPRDGASNAVNVNWPLPHIRSVGPVNEDGFAIVIQTWYDFRPMTEFGLTVLWIASLVLFQPAILPSSNPHTSSVLRPARWKTSQEASLYSRISS